MYMFQLILTFVLLRKRDLFVFLKQKTLTDVLFLECSSCFTLIILLHVLRFLSLLL